MKLNSSQVDQTVNQFPAQAIPDNHPLIPQLNQLFGDHTFFLDNAGLLIVEPAEVVADGRQSGKVVKLASWNDPSRTSLAAHEPEETDVVIVLVAA
ncbi:MAG TPA: hypothetical protein VH765_15735 [Xanthobacteraceae bacterium]|jgi:hypothetical protein